eukprot:1580674-Alexandrium_andersonii.AAC.1
MPSSLLRPRQRETSATAKSRCGTARRGELRTASNAAEASRTTRRGTARATACSREAARAWSLAFQAQGCAL